MDNKDEYMDAFYDTYPQDIALAYEDTIDYLVNFVSDDDFYKKFDSALVRISSYPQMMLLILIQQKELRSLYLHLFLIMLQNLQREIHLQEVFSHILQEIDLILVLLLKAIMISSQLFLNI